MAARTGRNATRRLAAKIWARIARSITALHLMQGRDISCLLYTSANHAGGLRYHGMSSIVSQLYDDGYVKARSVAVSYTSLDVYKRQALKFVYR